MTFPKPIIVGTSPAIHKVLDLTHRVSPLDLNVLITGESGVGKELVARSLHYHSKRRDNPFIKVNSAALPSELVESELFGYEKGAFTGAERNKKGKFEAAGEGSIFLDEIGELTPFTQSKMLQVLQDGEYYKVGGQTPQKVKARFITATNQDLNAEVNANNFRADLFFRLSTISIYVPPLRERKEDIPRLVEHFNKQLQKDKNLPSRQVPPELLHLFEEHHWPGNVRELLNYLNHYCVFGSCEEIAELIHSSQFVNGNSNQDKQQSNHSSIYNELDYNDILDNFDPENNHFHSLKEVKDQVVERVEKNIIEKVLQDSNWNRKVTAQKLKISYRALLYKMKEFHLNSWN